MKNNALTYLLVTELKNSFKEFIRKPVRLIFAVIIIAMFALTLFGASAGAKDSDRQLRDFSELSAAVTAVFVVIFSMTFYSGLERGGSIFKMADVNFIFPSPLNKRNVMFFGLIKQIGASLLVGVFILFQYTNIHINYGISLGGLFLIFLVYSLTVFLGQTSAMLLYIFVSDSDRKKNTAKYAFIAYIVLLFAYVGLQVLNNRDDILNTLVSAGNSLVLRSFPFAGWMSGFADGIFRGEYIQALSWIGLTVLAFWGILTAMSRSNREYYEDVLASTETTFNALSAAKEGSGAALTPRNIKVGKTGIGKGRGSSAIFYKHMLEKRRSGTFIFTPSELIFAIVIIGFSFFMKNVGIIPVLAFSSYMLMFSVTTGRFNFELMKPYIYLIPEPPLKKLIYALSETFPSALREAIVVFVPVGYIMGLSVIEVVLCIVVRVSFSLLFSTGIIVVERIWGGSLSKMSGVLLYFLVDIIITLPAVGLAFLVGFVNLGIFSGLPAILTALALGNMLTTLLVLFLCRNMLKYAET